MYEKLKQQDMQSRAAKETPLEESKSSPIKVSPSKKDQDDTLQNESPEKEPNPEEAD